MTVQTRAEVRATERHGAFQHVTLTAPGVVEEFRPGNFVTLALGSVDGSEPRMLRRSYWVHRVRASSTHGATVDLVVRPDGVAGTWLAGLQVGATIDLIGPLGRPFAQPKEPVDALLVGEGHSAAVLFPLAERLAERGCPVTLLLAGGTAADVIDGLDVRRLARAVHVVTGDGSMGAQGTVAQALPGILQRTGAAVVYAAGPAATLHAVAGLSEQHGAWSQVALEVPHPCGTGLCHGCIVPAVGEDAIAHKVRACTEGPVFRGDRIQWGIL